MKTHVGIVAVIAAIITAIIGDGTLFADVKRLEKSLEKGDIVGRKNVRVKYKDGREEEAIKYAFLGEELDTSLPKFKGLSITSEIESLRTKSSRTYLAKDGKFIVEIIAGEPQYFKDSSGKWWHAEYATTTVQGYEKLKKSSYIDHPSLIAFVKKVFANEDTFYPNADPESSSFDGYIEYNPGPVSTSWSNVRNSTTGSGFSDHETLGESTVGRNGSGLANYIGRVIVGFDTSAINDAATIVSATTSMYADHSALVENINDFVSIVQPSPASSTSFTNGDFDSYTGLFGAMTEGSSRIDISSELNTSSYNDFVLNSSGLSWISATGTSWFGIAEGHDILDSAIGLHPAGSRNAVVWTMSEYSGTSRDPKLIVAYTLPSVAPTAPTVLHIEGTSTPTYVSTSTPVFSAVYNDPNSGDLALFYQIQVSSTSSFATSSLIWDSGKKLMATTTQGGRSPDLKYSSASQLVFNAANYYWRIKFWDDEDLEGEWSGISQFQMGIICEPN